MVGLGIAFTMIVGIYLLYDSHADTNLITLTDITINPKILHNGDKFTMNVTVNNVGKQTVYFFTGSLYSAFDKNVLVSHYGGCSEVWSGNVLIPSQSKEFTLPTTGCHYYTANSSGVTSAIITLQYDIQKNEYIVNASKVFTILPS